MDEKGQGGGGGDGEENMKNEEGALETATFEVETSNLLSFSKFYLSRVIIR